MAVIFTLTSPQTTYTRGVNNVIQLDANNTSHSESYDRLQFEFPPAINIISATPISGTGICGSGNPIQSICPPFVSFVGLLNPAKPPFDPPGTPVPCSGPFAFTLCGWSPFSSPYLFTTFITVFVPLDFTEPLCIIGDARGESNGHFFTECLYLTDANPPPTPTKKRKRSAPPMICCNPNNFSDGICPPKVTMRGFEYVSVGNGCYVLRRK